MSFQDPIIVAADPAASGVQAHHRDFPEIRARGRSPEDAIKRLLLQLERTLDSALTIWRREAIEKAIAETQAFEFAHV